MSFFDTTPTGRILNRFSKDLDDVDIQLPTQQEQCIQMLITVILSLGLVAYIFPYFLAALFPIFLLYVYLVRVFKPCQRELKRLDSVSRSPVISWLSASLQGLPTLHAYGKERAFTEVCIVTVFFAASGSGSVSRNRRLTS